MGQLSTQLLGFSMRSPLIAAPGPMTRSASSVEELANAGIGAVITKTIVQPTSVNPQPCLCREKPYFFNTERCSTVPVEEWLGTELPRMSELGIPIIASIGMTPDDIGQLAKAVVRAGADMLELSVYGPNDDPRPKASAVLRAKESVDVPVIVKLGHRVSDIVEFGEAVKQAGADALSAIDAVKCGLLVNMDKRQPVLMEQGYGRMSGEAIKPLALYDAAQLAHYVRLPVVGTGGIMSGVDALEMICCGATAVGIVTTLLVNGARHITVMHNQMLDYLHAHGVAALDEIRGSVLSQIDHSDIREERREYELRRVSRRGRVAVISQSVCTGCGVCARSCPYRAVYHEDSVYLIEESLCEACGLCVSMCPEDAIELGRKAR